MLQSLGEPGHLVDFYLEEDSGMYPYRMLLVEEDGGFRVFREWWVLVRRT